MLGQNDAKTDDQVVLKLTIFSFLYFFVSPISFFCKVSDMMIGNTQQCLLSGHKDIRTVHVSLARAPRENIIQLDKTVCHGPISLINFCMLLLTLIYLRLASELNIYLFDIPRNFSIMSSNCGMTRVCRIALAEDLNTNYPTAPSSKCL